MRIAPVLFCALALAGPAAAQHAPDIEIQAGAQIGSMHFETAPEAGVDFFGDPRLHGVHDVQREGFEAPVVPGRRYRNVRVHTTISASLAELLEQAAQSDPAAPAPSTSPSDAEDPT